MTAKEKLELLYQRLPRDIRAIVLEGARYNAEITLGSSKSNSEEFAALVLESIPDSIDAEPDGIPAYLSDSKKNITCDEIRAVIKAALEPVKTSKHAHTMSPEQLASMVIVQDGCVTIELTYCIPNADSGSNSFEESFGGSRTKEEAIALVVERAGYWIAGQFNDYPDISIFQSASTQKVQTELADDLNRSIKSITGQKSAKSTPSTSTAAMRINTPTNFPI